jgi:hypothetical protein
MYFDMGYCNYLTFVSCDSDFWRCYFELMIL